MVWWIIAAFLSYFVKGLCGLANALVFSSILSFTAQTQAISPTDLLLGYPTNLIMVWQERRAVRWKLCLPLAALMLAGSIPGVLFLKNTDGRVLKIFFGFVIAFLGAEMLYQEWKPSHRALPRFLLPVIGVLSGLLCGLYGVGALMGLFMSRITEDSHEFKANLCVVFWLENTLRIILYACWGILTPAILRRALLLSPFMLAGLWLGMRAARRLDEQRIKRLVIVLLIFSGIALILTNF